MASQINNYQCPACTGPLHFEGSSGKLECEYCGSTYEVAEIEKIFAEEEAKAKKAYEEAAASGNGWDLASGESWGEDAQGMKAYGCPSCGAELICDDTTAATSCPYCGNPTVVPGQFTDTFKPDLIIPFKLDKEAAKKALMNHYKGKKLLPKTYIEGNRIEEITGVYVPFWLFDGSADATVNYSAESKTRKYQGDDEIITTKHYKVNRRGNMSFEKIPVNASSKVPADHMDSIEPFNYSELKDFSTAYLPGFLADKYDVEIETCAPRADIRIENSILDAVRSTVTGYDSVSVDNKDVRIKRGEVRYALFPVWMLSTKWQDKVYTFAMNGQTGKLVGDLPVDKGRLVGYFFKFFIPLAILFGIIGAFM